MSFSVGVTDAERAQPQRLLLSVEMSHDFSMAAATDRLDQTIDYFAVCQRLLRFGDGRSWRLIERLAIDIAALVCSEFRVASTTVEVKKFIIPETQFVAVRVTRSR